MSKRENRLGKSSNSQGSMGKSSNSQGSMGLQQRFNICYFGGLGEEERKSETEKVLKEIVEKPPDLAKPINL